MTCICLEKSLKNISKSKLQNNTYSFKTGEQGHTLVIDSCIRGKIGKGRINSGMLIQDGGSLVRAGEMARRRDCEGSYLDLLDI